jgi:hypothetical protein
MIFYLACCNNTEQARMVQNRLTAACPTLLTSHVLTRLSDLDIYNADLITTTDSETAVGAFAFAGLQAPLESPLRAILLWGSLVLASGVFAYRIVSRLLDSPFLRSSETMAGVASGLVLLVLACILIAATVASKLTAERWVFWRARRDLRQGRPVLLAASDEPPESTVPANIHFFLKQA